MSHDTLLNGKAAGSGAASDAFQSVEIDGNQVRIEKFCIENPDLVDYLKQFPPEKWEHEIAKSIELGVFCLVRATASRDTEFVKRQADRVISTLETHVGVLPKQFRDEVLAKIGTGEGQVLQPVNDLIEQVTKMLVERFTEVKTLFGEKLDPDRESSSLGRTLKTVASMVDPAT